VIARVKTVLAEAIDAPFDVVILTAKAYDLAAAIDSIAPAVGPDTAILPLLNGLRHLDLLEERFGAAAVLGGQCVISATLREDGTIAHLNRSHSLSFGERDGAMTERVRRMLAAMQPAKFEVSASPRIMQEMWEKWVFIATLAAGTCLFRASIGAVMKAPDGRAAMLRLLDECGRVAAGNGHAPRPEMLETARHVVTDANSPLTASMLRDIESNARTEADHVIGDLIRRGDSTQTGSGDTQTGSGDTQTGSGEIALLRVAYTHLKAYEVRRAGAAR